MRNPESTQAGYFDFDFEDPIFAEHFPGNPVVPGSLIIEAFMTASRAAMQGQGERSIEDFRFKHFIPPGRYAYRMESSADGSIYCSLCAQGRAVVTGRITAKGQGSLGRR